MRSDPLPSHASSFVHAKLALKNAYSFQLMTAEVNRINFPFSDLMLQGLDFSSKTIFQIKNNNFPLEYVYISEMAAALVRASHASCLFFLPWSERRAGLF